MPADAVSRGALYSRAEMRDSTPGPPGTRGASRHGERPGIKLVYLVSSSLGEGGNFHRVEGVGRSSRALAARDRLAGRTST